MRESSKYPINGICRFENFPEQNENNDFSKVRVGRMGGVGGWYVSLRTEPKDGINHIYPYLHCPPLYDYKQLSIRCFFSFLNQKPSENSQTVSHVMLGPSLVPIGNLMELDELLDEKNGWLSDGILCIEYGFCVESKKGLDGIWKFNCRDKLFDCDQKQNMITFEDNVCGSLYVHRQLLEFHSPFFKEETQTVHELRPPHWHSLLDVLQIINGANIRDLVSSYSLNSNSICKFNALNVRRYCERQFIEREVRLEDLGIYFWNASAYNLNHFLVHLLKYVKSGKCLTKHILKDMEIEKMSSEFMKQCTKYFFENA